MTQAQISTFRDCYEGGMEYDEALGCSGLVDTAQTRKMWAHFGRNY